MSWVRKASWALLLGFVIGVAIMRSLPEERRVDLIRDAMAQTACIPNPNAAGPQFINGCDIVASGLNALVGVLGTYVTDSRYGAVCDGVTDDTAAFNAAMLAAGTAGGGKVLVPARTCAIATTASFPTSQSGVHLIGQGRQATTISCTGTGTQNCINIGTQPVTANCVGSSPPSNCTQTINNSVESMTVNATARTGGFCFSLNGVAITTIKDIWYNCYALAMISYANSTVFQNMNGYTVTTTSSAFGYIQPITSASPIWYRSDYLGLYDITMNEQNKGQACFNWDGPAYDVVALHLVTLGCTYGIDITNLSANTANQVAAFGFFYDCENDGGTNTAVNITAGTEFSFIGCDLDSINAPNGTYIFNVIPDTSGGTTVTTHGVIIAGSRIHDGPNAAALFNAKEIEVSGSQFYDTNHHATGTNATIEVGASAADVSLTGVRAGKRFSAPDAPTYGLLVDAGATGVAAVNLDSNGATLGGIDNLSSAAVSYVGGITNGGVANTATTCAATSVCP